MRYYEAREQSAEILRQILPLMSKQAAGFHPVSYAVWYEYAAGLNPALCNSLDMRLGEGRSLSEDDTYQLFSQFILARDADIAERTETALHRVIRDVEDSAITLGHQAALYGESLDQYGERLARPIDSPALNLLISTLLGETTRMRASVESLKQQLADSSSEVSELREQLEKAQGQALIDPMTGLHNRRAFEQALAQEIASVAESNASCVLLLADIDHFKRINDTHGHLLGDKVIRAVGQVITKNIKGRDLAARYGGEEFAVLLPETTAEDGLTLAEKIRVSVARGRIQRAGNAEDIGAVTISIGVAESVPGETIERFIDRTDGALYESKQSGRNRVTRASSGSEFL